MRMPLVVRQAGKQEGWGRYHFEAAPSPGDEIYIKKDGRVARLKVECVVHAPYQDGEELDDMHDPIWVNADVIV